jgi:putative ABC transport system substrate-binding protein
MQLVAIPIDAARQIPDALDKLSSAGVEVIFGIPDSVVLTPQTAQQLLLFSFRNRIPLVGPSAAWVKAGALYALDWDYQDIGAQSAELALRVLAGTAPESVAPQSPRRMLYSLNAKTMRHMRIELPAHVIEGARQVF